MGPPAQAVSSPPPAVTEPRREGVARELGLAWLHLAVLWAFAGAKPLFDVLADSPEFFVARGNTRADILTFAIGLIVLPPTLLVAIEALVLRLGAVRSVLHFVFAGGLFALFAVQVLDDALDASSEVLVLLAGLLGVGAALAYARTRAVAAVLTVLSPAPVVFLLLFLLGPGISKLVLPQEATATKAGVLSDTPVVMLVFDEVDANLLMDERQRIDPSRYPNLAELARDSTWYPNATTVNSQTTMAVPALLSGRVPKLDQLPIAADYPGNLFTLFGDRSALDVTETATELCPERLCGARDREPFLDRFGALVEDLGIVSAHLAAPEGLESRLPSVDQTFGDFGGGGRDQAETSRQPDVPLSALSNRPAQFESLLRRLHADPDRPSLSFLHTAVPHIPWQYLPSGQQYINGGPDYPGLTDEVWGPDEFPARLGLQRHLLQVGYVDTLVGRLIARLRRLGIYDRALVVVTADHGVSFRAGQPRRGPTPGNFSDIASVPLLIKYPARRGGRIDSSYVRTVDVLPTIAAELGVELPWEAAGRPVGGGGGDGGEVAVRSGASENRLAMPFGEFVRQRDAGLSRLIFLFGSGEGRDRWYANGGHFDLIGRRAASLRRAPPARGGVDLDAGPPLDRVRPDAHLVPSFVSGRVSGSVDPGERVAVAVNGVIRATTETFTDGGVTRLAAIVPPRSFRAGANSLALFVVSGADADRRLAPLRTEAAVSYRLVEGDGGATIEGGGRSIAVEPGRFEGYVDSTVPDDQRVRFGGWAVAAEGSTPPDLLLFFLDGKPVGQGAPSTARPDIAARFGDHASISGFSLLLDAPASRARDVRVFAVSGDRAGELPRYEGP